MSMMTVDNSWCWLWWRVAWVEEVYFSVRRNFNSVGLPNLDESFPGMATRCQGLFRPRFSFPSPLLWVNRKVAGNVPFATRAKKEKLAWGREMRALLDDGIKVEMVCHDQQSGFLRTTGNFQWHRMRQKHDAVPLFVLVVVWSLCL